MQFDNLLKYTHIESTNQLIRYKIDINPQSEIFEGHFPTLPVLPGVIQVEIVKEILRLQFNKPYIIHNVKDIKFLTIINPETINNLECIIEYSKTSESNIKVKAFIAKDSVNYFKIRGNFCER